MNMKSILLAGAVALAPFAASAVTLDPANTLVDGVTYDVYSMPEFGFGATFATSDGAGTYTFTFENNTSDSVALTTTIATILQTKMSLFSGTGASIAFDDGSTGLSAAPGDFMSGMFMTTIGAMDSVSLVVAYGDPIGNPDIDLKVFAEAVAIPLPAGALLLGTALGGLGLARRRKS